MIFYIGFGENELRVCGIIVQFLLQLVDIDLQVLVVFSVGGILDGLQDYFLGYQLFVMVGQYLQEVEFMLCEMKGYFVYCGGMIGGVDFEWVNCLDRWYCFCIVVL